MKIKILALAATASLLSLGIAPAMAMEVGTTSTISNTITSGHLSIHSVDDHWDCGTTSSQQFSGDLQLSAGKAKQIGIGGDINGSFFGNGGNLGLGGSLFADKAGYVEISGNFNETSTNEHFTDHNVTTQNFSGQQTTSSQTISSATFTNF